jgi:hypothetical protein
MADDRAERSSSELDLTPKPRLKPRSDTPQRTPRRHRCRPSHDDVIGGTLELGLVPQPISTGGQPSRRRRSTSVAVTWAVPQRRFCTAQSMKQQPTTPTLAASAQEIFVAMRVEPGVDVDACGNRIAVSQRWVSVLFVHGCSSVHAVVELTEVARVTPLDGTQSARARTLHDTVTVDLAATVKRFDLVFLSPRKSRGARFYSFSSLIPVARS